MGERQWQPGDLAMLQAETSAERVGLRDKENKGWRTAAGYMSDESCPPEHTHRPLATIDPEDRESVERLTKVINSAGVFTGLTAGNASKMQAALREFANPTPPRPDEPTETFSLVEDDEGHTWCLMPEGGWKCETGSFLLHYEQVNAVRVLSAGVTDSGDA